MTHSRFLGSDLCVFSIFITVLVGCCFEDVINIFIVNVSMHLWSRYVLSLRFLHSYFTAVYIS